MSVQGRTCDASNPGGTLGSQTPGVPAIPEPSTTNNCWPSMDAKNPPLSFNTLSMNWTEDLRETAEFPQFSALFDEGVPTYLSFWSIPIMMLPSIEGNTA